MIHAREDYNRIQDPAGKIPEDEPVFIIRAQDIIGATVLRFWADENDRVGGNVDASRLAREQSDRMDAWPVKKIADL